MFCTSLVRQRFGSFQGNADVNGVLKIDENDELFAFTPTQSALRNDSIKPTKARSPMTPEKSAENMEGGPCKALLSRYAELWLCTVRFNNAGVGCFFSYTDSCIQSQASKSSSSHCAVIAVAPLINEVCSYS